jgi:hypothetical protein
MPVNDTWIQNFIPEYVGEKPTSEKQPFLLWPLCHYSYQVFGSTDKRQQAKCICSKGLISFVGWIISWKSFDHYNKQAVS